jgi:selenocysteine lyase/cysteine desulfurase
MSWVQYFNGFRNDLSMIGRLCHEHGCFFLVDVTQGAGAVPLNMRRDGVDAIACGTQKWLLGQTGGGFYAISPTAVRDVRPLYAGWLGFDWGYTWGDLQRWDRPRLPDGRFWEVGTYPFYSVRLVHAGLALLTKCGIKTVFSRIQALHARLIEGLASTQYQPLQLGTKHNRSGIVSLSGPKSAELHAFLMSKNIFVSLREGNIRVSPHFYNTGPEIDRLSNAIIQFERKLRPK